MNEIQIAGMNVHYYYYPFEYFLDVQRKLGCSNIELWGGTPHIWVNHLSYNDCNKIKREIDKRGQKIVVFTPESTSYRYSLCASEPDRHRKSMEYYKKCIKVSAELGAPYMCINATGKYEDESYDAAWERCVESVYRLCEDAKHEGVEIAIETLCVEQSGIMNTLAELVRLFSEVKSSNLKAVLDTVSVESAGESINQWFQALGEDIVHTHFVDGRNDSNRLIWGDGCYPLDRFLRKLDENGYKGYLGQEITARSYYENPEEADMKNIKALRRFIKE
jgi:fructoselysine 3-epimerase